MTFNRAARVHRSVGRVLAMVPLGAILLGAACGAATLPDPALRQVEQRVLFIGNSLTYVNDLPGTLAALAAEAGVTVEVQMVAAPNLALIDHVDGGTAAVDAIRAAAWDLVVVQQGPTTHQIDQDTLALAVRRLDPEIRKAGARVAVLMVWPPAIRRTAFDSVRASCVAAAAAAQGGICVPAGAAWEAALREDPTTAVYGADGFHPAEAGTYLAALVLHEVVTGRDARALPARARVARGTLALDEASVRRFQRIAHETLLRYPAPR
jgi:hypothetical protein